MTSRTEYRISIWREGAGYLFSTGWQDEIHFKKTFQAIYEGFPPGSHDLTVMCKETSVRNLTSDNLYRLLWKDEAGKTLDKVQKEIDGDDLEDAGGL